MVHLFQRIKRCCEIMCEFAQSHMNHRIWLLSNTILVVVKQVEMNPEETVSPEMLTTGKRDQETCTNLKKAPLRERPKYAMKIYFTSHYLTALIFLQENDCPHGGDEANNCCLLHMYIRN